MNMRLAIRPIVVALVDFGTACPALHHHSVTKHLRRYNLLLLLSELLFMVNKLHSLLTRPLLKFPFQCGVIMVFDVIVGTARQVFGDLRPSVAINLM